VDGQRHVAEGEAQAPVEALAHPADDRLRGGAVRALEVAVHDELQRGVLRTVEVVAWAQLLIFVTVGVIAVALVGQGLTLGPLMRRLGIEGVRDWSPDEAIARLEAAQAALDRLDELEREERISEERLRRMRELYRARFRRCMAVIGGDGDEARGEAARDGIEHYGALRRELIGVERDAIVGLRNQGTLRQETMRLIQRDLDLEEARLPA